MKILLSYYSNAKGNIENHYRSSQTYEFTLIGC